MTAATVFLGWPGVEEAALAVDHKEQYPVVVIGAGLGGLTCAAYLAKAGFPVTVVEQHHVPGGYATCFRRGAFQFDVSLHAVAAKGNETHRIFKELGLLDKLDLVELTQAHRLVTNGKDFLLPDRDPEAYIRLLSAYYPGEKHGIRNFVAEMLGVHEEVYQLFLKNNQYVHLFFPFQYSRMWNIRNKTLADLLDEHVADPELRNLLSYLCGYYGLPPSRLSGFYYANATADYLQNGSWYIRGQSQRLSQALVEVIRENGGQVMLNTPVNNILAKDGVVRGVRLADGNTLPAGIVVSNANLPDTFHKLLETDRDYADYSAHIGALRPSLSSFCIWLGLNADLRGKIPGCCIHAAAMDGVEAGFQQALQCDPEKVGYSVTLFDNYFQGYSPPGKSTVMITFLSGYEPWKGFEADYVAGKKGAYYRRKRAITDILLRRVEARFIPGLRTMIEESESSTPLTNLRYTRNPGGAIYGYEQSMDNHFMSRIKNDTPVEGLYLAGAWGFPGGGYTGVMRSGLHTCGMIIADLS